MFVRMRMLRGVVTVTQKLAVSWQGLQTSQQAMVTKVLWSCENKGSEEVGAGYSQQAVVTKVLCYSHKSVKLQSQISAIVRL